MVSDDGPPEEGGEPYQRVAGTILQPHLPEHT